MNLIEILSYQNKSSTLNNLHCQKGILQFCNYLGLFLENLFLLSLEPFLEKMGIFMIFMFLIELLVAFLQAYVFTLLSALYFGAAVEEAHH